MSVPFVPGDPRINRAGRPKRKHVSDAMLAELKKKPEGEAATYAQLLAQTAIKESVGGDAVWAKLLLSYVEGLPVQQVDLTSGGNELYKTYRDGDVERV